MPNLRSDFYLGLLTDKNPNVRAKAAKTLGELADTSVLPRLKLELETEQDATVRKAMEEAIKRLES